jgi:PEP-CTERM motif
MRARSCVASVVAALLIATSHANAYTILVNTGDPDGKIATGSRPSSAGKIEIESADDFILSSPSSVNHATFTGLLTGGASISDIGQVVIEIYRVFPLDSSSPPSGNVPVRANSPSDVAFDSRSTVGGGLSVAAQLLNNSFQVSNTVLNGINKLPGQFTGGEGAATGREVQFDVTFNKAFLLPADHYFFVPQVEVSGGEFLWLSAPKPIVPPGTTFAPDLQSWIRNENLDPDWLRVGTDITGQGPFNASFSLSGQSVPEPSSLVLLGSGGLAVAALASATKRRRQGRTLAGLWCNCAAPVFICKSCRRQPASATLTA